MYFMLKQLLQMTSFNSQRCLTSSEKIVKTVLNSFQETANILHLVISLRFVLNMWIICGLFVLTLHIYMTV